MLLKIYYTGRFIAIINCGQSNCLKKKEGEYVKKDNNKYLRFSIFILAIFVGYYVVWSVTPSLHTPLMSVTNAISSVIIVGAIIAALAGSSEKIFEISNIFGFLAIVLAAVNIFGGFLVTQRMLQMYKKKKKNKK